MATDHIRYDILAQAALRGVVRTVLADAAKKGLPGEHHFKISFNTTASGVRLSDRMRARYPQEMTIVLQHQFWDLVVTEQAFEVGLSFGGIAGAGRRSIRGGDRLLRSRGAIRLSIRDHRGRRGERRRRRAGRPKNLRPRPPACPTPRTSRSRCPQLRALALVPTTAAAARSSGSTVSGRNEIGRRRSLSLRPRPHVMRSLE